MNDIGLFLINNCFDISIKDDKIESDDGLETAVAISTFTDRRITEDDQDPLRKSKRGWWGDLFPDESDDQIGSRLWLLEREKSTINNLKRAEEYVKEGLDWMIDDGVAQAINTTASYNDTKELIIETEIVRPDGESIRYEINWDAQELRRS